jgi:hypothetical protein
MRKRPNNGRELQISVAPLEVVINLANKSKTKHPQTVRINVLKST